MSVSDNQYVQKPAVEKYGKVFQKYNLHEKPEVNGN